MNSFMLPLLVFGLCGEARTATLPHDEDVRYNLISYENDAIEEMTSIKPQAPDLYSQGKSLGEPDSPYVVEISKKFIKFQTAGFPPQKIKLRQNETEGLQKLSLRFVELLNSSKLGSQETETGSETVDWRSLSPTLTISPSGISLRFLNDTEPEVAENEEAENRDILWEFLTKYARNIFEAKVKELKLGEKYADVIGTLAEAGENTTAFENFENALWKIMRLSVDYAETAFDGWGGFSETTTTATNEEKVPFRGAVTTIFAYEELSPFHVFPSQEFEHRRKDVDSIFYGRGII